MGSYVLVNDIHLSDRAPSSCTDSYLDDLFDMLGQVLVLARARGAAAIILAGDVFHHKTPSRTSHATVLRLIEWARHCAERGRPVYTVLGNHDLLHDRASSIAETQPLGVCIASGAIKLLDQWADDLPDPVYGVPWQMRFDTESLTHALAVWHSRMRDDDAPGLIVTHAPLYPPGQELPYEFFPAADWAYLMGNKGTVHYGHVHHPHGIYNVDGVTFSNCGALSRGSLHEHNLTRKVQVAVWDAETGSTEHVTIAHKPAEEVFRLQEVGQAKAAAVELNTFLESVQAARIDITSTASVLEHIRGMGLDDDVVTVVSELLAQAGR